MIGTIAIIAAFITASGIIINRIGWRWFYIAAKTSKRDLLALFAYIRLLILVRKYLKNNLTISDIFEINCKKNPNKIAVIQSDNTDINKKLTFNELNIFSNKIANIFYNNNYKNGDVIALLLENSPEFIGIWLGLSKIGCIIPLINTNLRNKSLLHSIKIAKSKCIIYGENFKQYINDIKNDLYMENIKLYQYDNNNNDINNMILNIKFNTINIDNNDNDNDNNDNDNNIVKLNHNNKLLYIYTSGTTGLPKAAVISHARYIFICAGIHYTLNMKIDDIFYTPLPLYHTAGGIMSIGQSLIFGSTVVIRKKFSATNYFSDCIKYNCTVSQYIGEMCRYLLSTNINDNIDKKHNIRLMFGNGLRPQIWKNFVERFNIKQIGEFYGATEGNANISNTDGKIGAIGFISRIIPTIYPITIIKCNQDTGEPIRNSNGLCQICKPNEPGVFIGKIIPGNPSREFLGYVDQKASEKKIVYNVFKYGDSAFISGDILIADEFGYLYFKDRTGDTFRWKGENCSTSEIEAQLSNITDYRDIIVYGVEIKNMEGKAGMAAIYDPQENLNLLEFSNNIKDILPVYARPQFIRLLTKIDLTGTYKLKKIDLQKDGFNPNIIKDKLYYLDSNGTYKLLTNDIYEQIQNNKIRF
ncbi:long-chain fatty acid transport protein 1-like [Condylostylus longicornis]|uniref:long-chain fatty acid transport protein 1-like n=1 Tax=Condylostylus longicornis TaxID=2530218 RepID=UPI00244E229B|nr:long-chain fatty acid transport protein 1-like [Condylostylus longicornis]